MGKRFHGFALLWTLTLAGCGSEKLEALRRAAPQIPFETAKHLVEDDAAAFRRFAADRLGTWDLLAAFWDLMIAPPLGSTDEFLRVEAEVAPSIARVASVLNERRLRRVTRQYDAYTRRPVRERMEIVRQNAAFRAVYLSVEMPVAEKERRLRALIEASPPYRDALPLGDLYSSYAALLPRLKRDAEMPKYLKLAVQEALAEGDTASACQNLGTLGICEANEGHVAAMHAAWDRGKELARQSHSWQEARFMSFEAAFFRSQGKLVMARDLLLQAQDRCRELQAKEAELRFLLETLNLFADLECWDLVGNGLMRADVLLRQGEKAWSQREAGVWRVRLRSMRARHASATESCEAAERMALEIGHDVQAWELDVPREHILLSAAQSLLACKRPLPARRLLERGIHECDTSNMPELLADFWIEMATAACDLGDLQSCERGLDAFRSRAATHPPDNPAQRWVRHDALAVRVALQRHDRRAALQLLETGLQRLQSRQRELGASAEARLLLSAVEELREQVHEVLGASAAAGYEFEMVWRRSRARRGAQGAGAIPLELLEARPQSAASLRPLSRRHAVHCLYDVQRDAIVRWTADSSGVRRDVLKVPVRDLESRVATLVSRLAQRPAQEAASPSTLAPQLRQLATELLPEALLRTPGRTGPLVLVSPDGFLTQLPFEILNVAPSGFEPLLSRHDVAYLCFHGNAPARPTRGTMVVAQPAYPASFARRYSLRPALPYARAEAELVCRVFPQAQLLSDSSATKRNLEAGWQRARYLYFASHAVQDPDLPYVSFIPLALGQRGRDEDAYLEIADIRAADLSGCELVVLSNCASGAAYVRGHVTVPSLAEAFVNAGAHAVISTAWNVDDDSAARVMRAFAEIYEPGTSDPVAALCAARRELMREDAGLPVWAAYSVMLGRL